MSSTLTQFGFFAELSRLRQLLDAAKNHISELQENLDAKQGWTARLRNNLETAAEDSTEMMRQRDLARKDAEVAEAKLTIARETFTAIKSQRYLGPVMQLVDDAEKALAQIDAPKNPDAPAVGPSDTERLDKLEEMLGFPGNCFINRNGKRVDFLLMGPSEKVIGSYSSLATLRDTADCFIKLSRERAKEDVTLQAEKEPHA